MSKHYRYNGIVDALDSIESFKVAPYALWVLYNEPVNGLGNHPAIIAPSGEVVKGGTLIKDFSAIL